MLTSIVFSKDRALQLDLTLRSIKANLGFFDEVVVLYDISSDEHKLAYEKLSKEHENVQFIRQVGHYKNIFVATQTIIKNSKNDYIGMFTDDIIAYRQTTNGRKILDALETLVDGSDEAVYPFVFSLRLGGNTTQREHYGELYNDILPEVFQVDDSLFWMWTMIPYGGYWGYPLSLDGHIIRKKQWLTFFEELVILDRHYSNKGVVPRAKFSWAQTPNTIESKLQRNNYDLTNVMCSAVESCIVNSPNNRVQNDVQNSSGDVYNYDAEYLNTLFLNGARIALQKINFPEIRCPHTEIDILEGLK